MLLALGSCGPARDQFAPICPVPGFLKQLSRLVRYRGASQDVRDLLINAQISGITGRCEPGDTNRTVVTYVQVVVDAARGPAMQGDAIGLPVFVAVAEGDAIADKVLLSVPVEFQHNVDTARAVSREIRMELPVTPQKTAAAYNVVAGFQLTPDEVAGWRRANQR